MNKQFNKFEHRYSISEIESMRNALKVKHRCLRPTLWRSGESLEAVEQRHHARLAIVEDELRTHMMNGTQPYELRLCVQSCWKCGGTGFLPLPEGSHPHMPQPRCYDCNGDGQLFVPPEGTAA